MLINTHVHMSRYGADFSPELGEYFVSMFQGANCWHTGEPWRAEDFCVTPDQLVADMDAAGIDKVCVLGIAYKFGNSYDPDAAEYVGEMVADHPDRLIGFYTADPLGGLAEVRRFERAVADHGLRGLKMLPSYNYTSLHDRRIWPLYEAAEGMGVPVILHTGWSSLQRGKMLDYDHPLYAEDIAIDFPDLKLVLAHVGFMWAEEVMHFMAKFPNVYADLAWLPESAPLWRLAQMCSWAKKLGVLGRFLWGSDYPYTDFASGYEFLGRIPGFTERHELEPFITQEDMDSIFSGAAQRLLGFSDAPAYRSYIAGHC
jgi:uncharacterized protein